MKNFIQNNKKVLFIFLFFLCLTLASGIYLKQELSKNRDFNQIAAIVNQNSPQQQAQNQASSDSQNPTIKSETSAEGSIRSSSSLIPYGSSTSDKTSDKNPSSMPETGQKHALYVGEKKYEISVPENSTVYDLMNALKQRGDIDFQGKNSAGLGFFVEEINGVKNSASNNTYWIYYINGKVAEVGISNYILKPNDVINWKYEKPQF